MGNVLLSTTGLPEDYCFTTSNQLALDIIANSTGNFVTSTIFSTGNATPSVANQDKPWFRYNSDGTPDGWYVYVSGNWLSKHPQVPNQVIMYEGTEASIVTFDGGEAGAITPTTGAFWEKVSQMDARSPIGPGTTASGLVIAIGDDLGEDEHTFTMTEMPEHTHEVIGHMIANLSGGDSGAVLNKPEADDFVASTEPAGEEDPDPVSLIHPAHAIWFLRRTARLYRRI